MNLNIFAKLGLLCLLMPMVMLAANLITGSEENDTIFGTDADDEIRGGTGSDEIHGGAGDDILIGGKETDIMSGGPGSDNFVIDFLSKFPDKFMDFRPEEGDTLTLRFPEISQVDVNAKNCRISSRGVLTVRLLNGNEVEVANLQRHDLSLRIDPVDKEIRLNFVVNFF